jgi:hypothetical protein
MRRSRWGGHCCAWLCLLCRRKDARGRCHHLTKRVHIKIFIWTAVLYRGILIHTIVLTITHDDFMLMAVSCYAGRLYERVVHKKTGALAELAVESVFLSTDRYSLYRIAPVAKFIFYYEGAAWRTCQCTSIQTLLTRWTGVMCPCPCYCCQGKRDYFEYMHCSVGPLL